MHLVNGTKFSKVNDLFPFSMLYAAAPAPIVAFVIAPFIKT